MIIEQPAASLQEQAALERQVARFYRWTTCLDMPLWVHVLIGKLPYRSVDHPGLFHHIACLSWSPAAVSQGAGGRAGGGTGSTPRPAPRCACRVHPQGPGAAASRLHRPGCLASLAAVLDDALAGAAAAAAATAGIPTRTMSGTSLQDSAGQIQQCAASHLRKCCAPLICS